MQVELDPGGRAAGDIPRARSWLTIVVLTAIDAYAFIDASVLALLVDPIKHHLHANDMQMGLMLGSAFAALYGIFSVPAGYYVDHVNRKRLIAAASVVWALMTIVCGTAQSLTQLFVGRIGVGISEAVLMPAIFSIIRDALPHHSRGVAFSIYAMSPMVGGGVSLWGGSALLRLAGRGIFASVPLIGGLQPWQQTMVVVALLGLPLSALLLFAVEPVRRADQHNRPGAMLGDLVIAARYMIERRQRYLPLLGFAIFSTMVSFGIGAWLPTSISRHLGVAPDVVGPPLGILNFVGGIAGLSLTGLVMARIARRGGNPLTMGAVLCLATAAGGGGAALAPGATASYILAGASCLTIGSAFAVGAAALAEITDDLMMGRVSSIYFLFQNVVGQSLGPVMVPLFGSTFFTGPQALPEGLLVSLTAFALLAAITAAVLSARMTKDHPRAESMDSRCRARRRLRSSPNP